MFYRQSEFGRIVVVRTLMAILASLALAAMNDCCADPEDEAEVKPTIRPDFSKALLSVGGKDLRLLRVGDRWPIEHLCGKSLVRIRKTAIESLDHATGKSQWQSKSEDGRDLAWLGEHDGVLFLAASFEDSEESGANLPCIVRRLKLLDGKWLEPLKVPVTETELKEISHPTAILADGDGVLVLSTTEKDKPRSQPLSYRVSRFRSNTTDVAWSTLYPSGGAGPKPESFVIGARGPAMSNAAIQKLSRLGSAVLICAGPKEDLIALNPGDGKDVWRVPRIWEYRRGFVGPSVWQYFLERYGNTFADKGQTATAARSRVENQLCSIVGGPVIVELPKREDYEREFSIFVATAQSEKTAWPDFLSECVMYEVNEIGRVIASTALPRFVQRDNFTIVDRSVAWRCDGSCFAKFFPSPADGNSDLKIDFEWRVERDKQEQKDVWLQSGQWQDPVAFIGNSMIRVPRGGYVDTPTSKVCRLPISMRHINTRSDRGAILNVPFEGQIPVPTTNYSNDPTPKGEDRWTVYGSFPLSIVGTEIRGGNLTVAVESETDTHTLEFESAGVFADK